MLHAQEHPTEEHAHRAVIPFSRSPLDRPRDPNYLRIMVQAVKPTEPCHGLVDRLLDVGFPAHTRVHIGDCGPEFATQLRALVILHIRDDDATPFLDKQSYGSLTDPT